MLRWAKSCICGSARKILPGETAFGLLFLQKTDKLFQTGKQIVSENL